MQSPLPRGAMEICDVCGEIVVGGSGGLLSTTELVSLEGYWRKFLTRVPEVLTLAPAERDEALDDVIESTIAQDSAWLLCPSCLSDLTVADAALHRTATARRRGEPFAVGPASRS